MTSPAVPKQLRLLSFVVRGLVGLALLAGALMLFNYMKETRQKPAGNPDRQVARHAETITASSVSVPRRYTGYGTARAMLAADLAAEISANVMDKPAGVEEGQFLEAGAPIVTLDGSDFLQQQGRALANIEAFNAQLLSLDVDHERLGEQYRLSQEATRLAQSELSRLREARRSGGTTDIEIDRSERELTRIQREEQALQQSLDLIPTRRSRLQAQVAAEEAELALAAKNVSRASIVAPFAGYLQEVTVDVGEHVAPGTSIARLVDLSRIEVPLQVPVSAAGVVKVGDLASIKVGETDPTVWEGAVIRIAPEADQGTRSLTVYIEVEQPARLGEGAHLRPGQFVLGEVRAEQNERAIVVPRRAVVDDRVLVIDEAGLARSVAIVVARHFEGAYPQIDPEETEWAVIHGGLEEGDIVIISNLDELESGMAVQRSSQEAEVAGEEVTP
jgi:RND family efflux transporter MFP subunit